MDVRTPKEIIDYGDEQQAVRRCADDALNPGQTWGKQISGMTFEEEQAYIRQRLRDEPTDGISGAC